MNSFYLLIVTCIVFCQSISSQPDTNTTITIKSDFDNASQVKMSELFSEIRYVPLETSPDCIVGNMSLHEFGENIILRTLDGRDQIFRFSINGKFLNIIGNKGRGPEEYSDISNVRIIDNAVYVVSNFSRNISCYSLDGIFLKKIHLKIEGSPSDVIKISNDFFFVSLSNTSKLGRLLKTDSELNVKLGFFKENPISYTPHSLSFSESGSKVYYYYTVVDTIFEISNGSPSPAFIIDHGKYNKPKKFVSIPGDSKDDDEYPQIIRCEIYDNYVNMFLLYAPQGKLDYLLYRISDNKTFNIAKLINDYDSGTVDRWFGQLTHKNILVFTLMPTTILKRFQNMTKDEKEDPKNSKFVEMASSLTLDSNPVLMVCKLK